MILQLYDNEGILAPLKCGTRFLDKVFGIDAEERRSSFINQSVVKRRLFFPKLHTLIVRPPREHIYSALHTDILTAINNEGETDLDIESILKSYTTNGKVEELGHWDSGVYETLYWMWRRNRGGVEVVELKDLSNHLTDLGFDVPPYNPKDYGFNWYRNHCSVGELILFIKENYDGEWRDIETQIEKADVFYDYLIRGEIIDVQTKLI